MHGTEPCWYVELRFGNEDRLVYSANAYVDLLFNGLDSAHALTRDHLQITTSGMNDWYDKKIRAQDFQPRDEVYVLNLRMYQGRCPKWLCWYSDVATVVKKINQVTYVVCGDAWRIKEK